jgi:hypothetical protein
VCSVATCTQLLLVVRRRIAERIAEGNVVTGKLRREELEALGGAKVAVVVEQDPCHINPLSSG